MRSPGRDHRPAAPPSAMARTRGSRDGLGRLRRPGGLVTRALVAVVVLVAIAAPAGAAPQLGYYRMPALSGETLVFVAEGDLWQVGVAGGAASRLTTHPGAESSPVLSADGARVAFTAEYEGPSEVYVLPLCG